MNAETYTCAQCGKTYKKGWSEDDALRELEENFSGFDKEDCVVICDDCYKAFIQ